ncbi:MAG: cadherin-like domain-containing protein, partial [Gammaproteobacteria bacterium]
GTLTTTENTAASGTLIASDPDGDALTYSIVTQPANGQVTLTDAASGAYTYTPNNGYRGADSFTFQASDGTLESNVATISVAVNYASCSDGYIDYNGSLNTGKRSSVVTYQAPLGQENAILIAPTGFQLYAIFQNARGRKTYRIPGNEIHHLAPAGQYTWVVAAGSGSGGYTLCIQHP